MKPKFLDATDVKVFSTIGPNGI